MPASTENIYCLSGLGADGNAFSGLRLSRHRLKYLPYPEPLPKESLSAYAGRMFACIPEQQPILLGLSFGGMVAIEMARRFPVRLVILISAVKTAEELPAWMRWSGRLRLHRILPLRSNRFTEKGDDRRMGIRTPEEKELVESYRRNADPKLMSWAIDQVLRWNNDRLPPKVFHIHGSEDRMFPLRNLQATHVIEGGTHIMILNRAGEISACLEEILVGGW